MTTQDYRRLSQYMRILFRIGPISMLIPIGVLGVVYYHLDPHPAVLNKNVYRYNHGDLFSGCIVAGAVWHLALIVCEKGRRLAYLAYAVLYMPLHFLASLLAFIKYLPF